jgi:exodeoxyribonuclease V alpha subunit
MSDEKQIKCTVKVAQVRHFRDNWGIVNVSLIDSMYGIINTDKYNCFIVKGGMSEPNYQDTYTIVAKEVDDPKWGRQYNLIYMGVAADISDEDSQKTFLSKILTPLQVENLYNTLENPMAVLENGDIKQLTKVKGIGVRTAVALIERYKEHVDYSVAYIELDKYGLTPYAIRKIVDNYKSPEVAIQKIKENPYILADEIEGIGWKKADSIALSVGTHPHSPERIKAFIIYYLEKNAEEGFSWISPSLLMDGIVDNIGAELDDEHLREVIASMKDILWWDEEKTKIGLRKYFDLEYNIADELMRILHCENTFKYDGWSDRIKEVEKKQGWDFTSQQLEGIRCVLENQVVFIHGLGGTGKTSIVAGVLEILKDSYSFSQCALSGRAAARMTEVTGVSGYTIHRLLGCQPPLGFAYKKDNQLKDDIIIVDEVSMIGGYLFYQLIQAVRSGAKLIMLADIGQLESIGLLNVASDIIYSNMIPTVYLTQIHRQAQKSAIITESIKVRQNQQICKEDFYGKEIKGELQDLELDIYVNKAHTANKIIEKFKENLPKADNIFDIQVVVPMKVKGASTYGLNEKLQNICNPYNPSMKEVELSYSKDLKYKLRVGDKVINMRNNYKTLLNTTDDEEVILTPIFNGNIGVIKYINTVSMIIDFNCIGEVIVPREHWTFIELGYAITLHKMQGSEAKIIIVGFDFDHYVLLTKEWVYTALTRAKEYCVLCAEGKALRYAISHNGVSNKKTHLKDLLKNYGKEKMKEF